jgi:hypothetical protein
LAFNSIECQIKDDVFNKDTNLKKGIKTDDNKNLNDKGNSDKDFKQKDAPKNLPGKQQDFTAKTGDSKRN